jgi:hypothetical protein
MRESLHKSVGSYELIVESTSRSPHAEDAEDAEKGPPRSPRLRVTFFVEFLHSDAAVTLCPLGMTDS